MNKILCITHKYPPVIGGMEKQSYELIKGLSAHYETIVIAYKDEGNKALWFKNLKSEVQRTLKNHPDIKLIHLNDGLMGAFSIWLQNYIEIPVVVTYHGLDITFPSSLFQNKIIPKFSNYQGAICVSDATRDECIKRGFNPETTFTVLNGVDKDMAHVPFDASIITRLKEEYDVDTTNKRIIMTMGRPVKRKGFSWFLKNVMPLLEDEILFLMVGPLNDDPSLLEKGILNLPGSFGHNIQLMFGVTSDAPYVIEQVAEHSNVYHLGKVPYDDLLQILALAELFIMPNISVHGDAEGFGLVALEASMRGTPVVASGIEGITNAVIHGKNGYLLPSEDPQAWVDKIHELLDDREHLEKFSEQSRSFTMETYSWEKMVEGYVAVFDQMIDQC